MAYDTSGTISCLIPSLMTPGTGYRIRVISSSPADTTLDAGKNISISGYPASIQVNTNSPVCTKDSIRLYASTSTNVNYKWTGPGNFNSTLANPVIGDASSGMAGDYIITFDNVGCKVKDTVTVGVKPLPAKPVAGSNTPVCPGTSLYLTGSAMATGVVRHWEGPGSFTSNSQSPVKNNVVYADAGNYVVTDSLIGCFTKDTAIVFVYITTPTPTATSNSPICLGGTANFNAGTITGASYTWTGPNNFNATGQSTLRKNIAYADTGAYNVTAKVNGCVSLSGSVSISAVHGPYVSVYTSPKDTVCTGANAALVSIPFGIGPQGATYQWYKNGSLAGIITGNYIVPNPNNGDKFYVEMTAIGSVCTSPIQSNTVTLTVLPATPPPLATIVANPGTDVWPGLNVNFSSSNLSNGGSSPTYQWIRNSKNVAGATTNKWSTTDLKDGDSICLMITSSDQCATPKTTLSNCLKMKVPTQISALQKDLGINLYPNPNNGNFIIDTKENGALHLYNIQGQEVSNYHVSNGKTNIQLSISQGIYLCQFISDSGNTTILRLIID